MYILWKMQAESLAVFPEGIGIIPYMTPGTNKIGEATAAKMSEYKVVMWPHHGIFAVGSDSDETLGWIETVEKAASILITIEAQSGTMLQDIKAEDIKEL